MPKTKIDKKEKKKVDTKQYNKDNERELTTEECLEQCMICLLSEANKTCFTNCKFNKAWGIVQLVQGTIDLYNKHGTSTAIEQHWAKFPPSIWNYAMDKHLLDEYLVTVVECDAYAHYDELAEHSENAYYRNKETMAAQEIHL